MRKRDARVYARLLPLAPRPSISICWVGAASDALLSDIVIERDKPAGSFSGRVAG